VNLTGYRSAAYDSVFDQSTIEQDSGRRRLLFRRLESILQRDAPLVLLTHEGPRHYVVPGFVRGLVLRFTTPDFALIWLDRHEDAR
jgi:ABC-type oligopeptide transport system substrate-binding subunit